MQLFQKKDSYWILKSFKGIERKIAVIKCK